MFRMLSIFTTFDAAVLYLHKVDERPLLFICMDGDNCLDDNIVNNHGVHHPSMLKTEYLLVFYRLIQRPEYVIVSRFSDFHVIRRTLDRVHFHTINAAQMRRINCPNTVFCRTLV